MQDLLIKAFKYYGIREYSGKATNPVIQKMIDKYLRRGHGYEDSTIAWCAIFVNYVLEEFGYETTRKLNAKSFLGIGQRISLANAQPGDVVIFHRGRPGARTGHVFFYVRQTKNFIYGYGGNQSNAANIRAYRKRDYLGTRRLSKLQA